MLAYVAPHNMMNVLKKLLVGYVYKLFCIISHVVLLYLLISSDIWIFSGVQLLIIIFSVVVISIPARLQ